MRDNLNTTTVGTQVHHNKLVRGLLIVAGFGFVALGVIGIFVPVMPTTIFLILAASCFIRSSDKFYKWLIGNRYFGKFILNYREKRGITRKSKLISIVFLWLTISISIYFVNLLWVRILLLLIAGGVTWHILAIRTYIEPEGDVSYENN